MKIKYFISKGFPDILINHPEPVIKKLEQKGYHKCWAHQFSNLNKFYFKSFFDYDFTFIPGIKNNELKHNNNNISISNSNVVFKQEDMVYENRPVFQLFPSITFMAEETCFIELQHSYYTPKELKIISGKFDISKWTRPIQIAFETNFHTRIKINRETTLCEIAFYTKKLNEPIKLEYIENPSEQLREKSLLNSMLTSFVKKTKNLINSKE